MLKERGKSRLRNQREKARKKKNSRYQVKSHSQLGRFLFFLSLILQGKKTKKTRTTSENSTADEEKTKRRIGRKEGNPRLKEKKRGKNSP